MVLPLSIQEKVSEEHYRKSPSTHREVVMATNHAGIDDQHDTESIKKFIDDIFREIDIFSNDITFMQNRFVSPLSSIGTDFYKYYLDTIVVDGAQYYELSFTPFTTETFGFTGRLYVPANLTIFDQSTEVIHGSNLEQDENYWVAHRPVVAVKNEHTVKDMLTS